MTAPIREMPEITLDQLCLPVRARNCLKNMGVETVADIVPLHRSDLLRAPNMGAKSVADIERELRDLGLKLEGKPRRERQSEERERAELARLKAKYE